MTTEEQAIQVVQRQLDCYNQRDLEQFLSFFADDAQIVDGWTGWLLAEGLAEIRPRYAERFQHPVHCELLKRHAFGNTVTDRETITGLPEGDIPCRAKYTVDIPAGKITKCILYWDHPPNRK